MAKRVFELARELGVTSKTVLEKCRAEDIELKNHMSALSAGLEATIREWFGDAAMHTAVETTTHVDLKAARKRAASQRRRRKEAEAVEEEAPAEEPAAPVAVAEDEVEIQPAQAPEPVLVGEVAPAGPAVVEAPPAAEAVEAAAVGAEVPVEAEKPEEEAPPEKEQEEPAGPRVAQAVPNKPVKPEIIKPAGPQVVPKPAKLQGPRVVRFEGRDVVATPRRPSTAGPPAGFRGAGPAVATEPGKIGRGTVGDTGRVRRPKRRSPRRKSGRSAEVGEKLREWRDVDLAERSERLAAASGGALRRARASVGRGRQEAAPAGRAGQVEIEEPISVKTLSAATGIKIGDILRRLMQEGMVANINRLLDRDIAETVAMDYGMELRIKVAKTAEELLAENLAKRPAGEQNPRAPIVTFLGHVDHGKTSLLDRIRHAAVVDSEDGGITQHVGAYRYDVADKHVVFLDTPGHEAFTAMRARGANMTDVVVLVVAADDGVMPQTIEAVNHAKAANVPIMVALNKVDLPNANVQRALGQLAEQGLQPRQWGGQTEVVETSAVTGDGIEELVETLSLEAELLELRADPTAPASGYVIESERDPSRGVLVRVLVRDGTLRAGDAVLCGQAHGRVRTILDDKGKSVTEAGPATPVEITGVDEVPDAGDRFYAVDDLSTARLVADERREMARAKTLVAAPQASLEGMLGQIEAGEMSVVRLIVKADVQGSLEALLGSLARLGTDEVKVEVLHSGVGGITEGDVLLAEASQAVVLGFRVVADHRARAITQAHGVDIRTYRVIYEVLEDIKRAVAGMTAPEMVEEITGRAEVRQVFRISRLGSVAGCYVTDGVIPRNAKVRLIRDNVVIEDGRQLDSLKRFKDDVRDVRAGLECGLKIAGFDDVKVADVIEAYQTVEVAGS